MEKGQSMEMGEAFTSEVTNVGTFLGTIQAYNYYCKVLRHS